MWSGQVGTAAAGLGGPVGTTAQPSSATGATAMRRSERRAWRVGDVGAGVMVLLGGGTREGVLPSCRRRLAHARIGVVQIDSAPERTGGPLGTSGRLGSYPCDAV